MAVAKETVLDLAPELSPITDGQWTAILAAANALYRGPFSSDDAADRARVWYAAHLATLLLPGDSDSTLKRVTVGAVTKEYNAGASAVADKEGLQSTKYGKEFRRLVRAAACGPGVA